MKDKLKEIIKTFHSRKLPEIVAREIKVPLTSGKIISLIGSRRAGKTYLLYQLMHQLLDKGYKKEQLLFLNFEDERLTFTGENLDLILEAYKELYPEQKFQEVFVFFDEVQNAPDWERFLRRIYDQETKNIFLTGSNAKILSKEIATALRGRTLPFEVYPLSFREYLSFSGVSPEYYDVDNKARIISHFSKFLREGGFPEVVLLEDEILKPKVLQEYFNVMIFRDLVERFEVSNIHALKFFIKKIFASVTSPFSVNKVYRELKSLGVDISKNTLYEYLDYISDSYLSCWLQKYDLSPVKQQAAEKKAYVLDNGLLTAINFQVSEDNGKLLENLAAMELKKLGKELLYFKRTKECDFVVSDGKSLEVIQVTWALSEENNKRELEGLLQACKELNLKKGLILTNDQEDAFNYSGLKVEVKPCWKFFLGEA